MISDKEFGEWLEHPVTKALRDFCKKRRQVMKDEWENTSPTEYLKETFVNGNVANLGYAKAMREIQELEFSQLTGELNERD